MSRKNYISEHFYHIIFIIEKRCQTVKNNLKKWSEVDKNAKIKHSVAIAIELALSLASLVVLIVYLVNGDPNNRTWSCIGSILIFLVPLLIELIFRTRFSFMEHIFFTLYMIGAVFLGCAFNFHNGDNAYDEIMHFIFGYVSCIFFFYIFLRWKDYEKQNPYLLTIFIVVLSMGVASIWECMETFVDIFLGQNSLGFPTAEFIKEMDAQGITGIKRNLYELMYSVTVWDTVSDMSLHLGGSVIFAVQYVVHRKIKKPLMLAFLKKEFETNKKQFFNEPTEKEVTCSEEAA